MKHDPVNVIAEAPNDATTFVPPALNGAAAMPARIVKPSSISQAMIPQPSILRTAPPDRRQLSRMASITPKPSNIASVTKTSRIVR